MDKTLNEMLKGYLTYDYSYIDKDNIRPSCTEGYEFLIGAALEASGKDAYQNYFVASRFVPEDFYGYYFKGRALLKLYELASSGQKDPKLKESADLAFKSALALSSETDEYLAFFKGWLLLYFKRFLDATAAFKNSISLNLKLTASYYYRGICYMELRDYQKAIEDFESAIHYKTSEINTYRFAADCHLKMNNYARAAFCYDVVLSKSQPSERVYISALKANMQNKDYAKCSKILLNAKKSFAESLEIIFLSGQCALLMGDYAQAIGDYTKIIVQYPNESAALIERANAYLLSGRTNDAIDDFNRVLKINPNQSEVFYNLAKSYLQKKDFSSAAEFFSRVLALNGDDIEALFYRSKCYIALDDLAAALVDLERYAALKKDGDAYYECAILNKKLGKIIKAQNYFELAIEHKVLRPDAYYECALEAFNKRNYIYCAELCGIALKIQPENSELNTLRARAYIELKDFEKAKSCLFTANSPSSRTLLAEILFKNGDDGAIVSLFKGNFDSIPQSNLRVFFILGDAAIKQGDFSLAERCFSRIIELDEKNEVAHNNLGKAYEGLNQKNRALECFNRALSINPSYSCALNNRAVLSFSMMDFKSAQEDYDLAIQTNPKNAVLYYNRGVLNSSRKGKKQPELAQDDYNKALELDPSLAKAKAALASLKKN